LNGRKKETIVLMLILLGAVFVALTIQSSVSAGPRVNFNISPDATVTLLPVSGSPNSGPIGTVITVTGSGFTSTEGGPVTFTSTPDGLFSVGSSFTCNVDSIGAIVQPCQFTVSFSPTPAVAGTTYTVKIAGTSPDLVFQTFTVTTPSISVSPTAAAPGYPVTVSGSGYSPLDSGCSLVANLWPLTHSHPIQSISGSCAITSPGSGTITGTLLVPTSLNPDTDFGIYAVFVNGTYNDKGFTSLLISAQAISVSTITSYTSTSTSSSTTTTTVSTTSTTTSTITSTYSTTGLSSATYTVYSTTSTIGPTTTSITVSPTSAVLVNVTTTGGTVFITVTIPTTITVTGFITGAVAEAASGGTTGYLGLIGAVLILGWALVRRLLG
jgi:hypothetical protein